MDAVTRVVTRLTTGESNTFAGPFSPDGRRILFTGFGLVHSFVGVMNADGTSPQDLSQNPDRDEGFPAWSPDGSLLAFQTNRDGNWEIYIVRVDGSDARNFTQIPADDQMPYWK